MGVMRIAEITPFVPLTLRRIFMQSSLILWGGPREEPVSCVRASTGLAFRISWPEMTVTIAPSSPQTGRDDIISMPTEVENGQDSLDI